LKNHDLVAEAMEARRTARELVSAADVTAALDRMAEDITADLERENPVVLGVMHGGVFTAVELSRRLAFPHEFDFVHATRYGSALTGGELSWRVHPRAELRGRVVLVVDDILDQGVTLTALYQELLRVGVAAMRSAVLVSKELESPTYRPPVDYVGLQVGDAYIFGCGMDYKGYWRGLTALYALES